MKKVRVVKDGDRYVPEERTIEGCTYFDMAEVSVCMSTAPPADREVVWGGEVKLDPERGQR